MRYCLMLLLLFLFLNALSQDSTAVLSPAVKHAIDFYGRYMGENSALYNGSEYVAYDFRIKGHPYFQWGNFQSGSVSYSDIRFDSVNLAYDIVRDELITNTYNDNVRIRLVSEKIAWFSLLNHIFVRLNRDSSDKAGISTGFYERLYAGKMNVYAKYKKKISEVINTYDGDQLFFIQSESYYVEQESRYYPVSNASDLYDLFGDRKKEIKKFLRKNKWNFKKNKAATIIAAVQYNDQLTNKP